MTKLIPVIDLFAGPGGLGEGFSAFTDENSKTVFKIKLSIEKDPYAHNTLQLRSFFRQFPNGDKPKEYYSFLRGEIGLNMLYQKFPEQYARAKTEAWLAELGSTSDQLIDKRISEAISDTNNWVLIGGPPCQAYSLAGRSRMKPVNGELFEKDPRHFLYKQYLRILAVHRPPVFIMENVKGLLSAKIDNQSTFDRILEDLRQPYHSVNIDPQSTLIYKLLPVTKIQSTEWSYKTPKDFIVRSEEFGIPQMRHRIIILGVRSDVSINQLNLLEPTEKVSVGDVIDDLPRIRSGISKNEDTYENWKVSISQVTKSRWFSEISDDFKIAIMNEIINIEGEIDRGRDVIEYKNQPNKLSNWFLDSNQSFVCNHHSRSHIIEDLHRYFFAATFAKVYNRSPSLSDYPLSLLPKHKNVKEAIENDKFGDRFRVQLRNRPSSTIVSHISKDGHYYIHYEPSQCRSLTVREAARIQTFPDNYYFVGPQTQQFHQVGNAVPPFLAKQIAKVVADIFD